LSIDFRRPRVEVNLSDYEFEGFPENIEWQNLQLKVNNTLSYFDIGSLCYLKKRKLTRNYQSGLGSWYLVDSSSFSSNRLDFIEKYIRYIFERYQMAVSVSSIHNEISNFRRFVHWCDDKYMFAFETFEQLCIAYSGYSKHLLELVHNNKIQHSTAVTYQADVLTILTKIMGKEYYPNLAGVTKIFPSSAPKRIVVPISNADAERCSNLYGDLFDQFSDFILGLSQFPFKVKFSHGEFTIFPNHSIFSVPSESGVGVYQNGIKRFLGYNFYECRISTEAEVTEVTLSQSRNKLNPAAISRIVKNAEHRVSQSNANYFIHSDYR